MQTLIILEYLVACKNLFVKLLKRGLEYQRIFNFKQVGTQNIVDIWQQHIIL